LLTPAAKKLSEHDLEDYRDGQDEKREVGKLGSWEIERKQCPSGIFFNACGDGFAKGRN
jgi:hypothetical protein